MSNAKRYYSFLFGIIAASVTWSIVLYLYVKLGSDLPTNFKTNDASANYSIQNSKEKQIYNIEKDVVLPYESNMRSVFYQKEKYYKNSEKLIKQLQPIIPTSPVKDLESELGLVKTVQDQKKRDEGYKNYAFNILVSDGIGFHRELPDTRHQLCKKKKYNTHLPVASIVICFNWLIVLWYS